MLLLLYVFLSPLIYYLIGKAVFDRCLNSYQIKAINLKRAEYSVLGLGVFLLVTFLVKLAGLSWFFALTLCVLIASTEYKAIAGYFKLRDIEINLNLVLWLTTIFLIGLTLFSAPAAINTPWKNNYGDLAFHLGMISSFQFSDNFPPQYHIFAGQVLSYPFFVNLWSNSLWWFSQDFKTLPIIFCFQWVFVWGLVYFLLKSKDKPLLPWAIIFGGGTFAYLGQNSGELIEKNVPWTLFLTTVWIPQRSSMLGLPFLLLAVKHSLNFKSEKDRSSLIISGATLSLMPLIHMHFFIIGTIFCSLLLIWDKLVLIIEEKNLDYQALLIDIASFYLPFTLSLASIPWVLDKQSIISPSFAWNTGGVLLQSNKMALLEASLKMWLTCISSLLVLFFSFCIISKRYLECFFIALLFIVANFIRLSYWEWDQIKLFIAIYILWICVWSDSEREGYLKHLSYIWLLLCIPTLWELLAIVSKGDNYEVYSKFAVAEAIEIRNLTTKNDIIAGARDHNSSLTISGRYIYYGYEGTLASHGLDYKHREKLQSDYSALLKCDKTKEICPTYLLDKNLSATSQAFQELEITELPGLYKIKALE